MQENKVWLVSFDGHWLPGKAVVVAPTIQKARNDLSKVLEKDKISFKRSLKQTLLNDQFEEVDLSKRGIAFYDNGDY